MKKTTVYITCLIAWATLLFSCADNEIESAKTLPGAHNALTVHFTTPDLAPEEVKTRGSFSGGAADEATVNELWLLVFESDGSDAPLVEKVQITNLQNTPGNTISGVAYPNPRENVLVRLVANVDMSAVALNTPWSTIHSTVYSITNTATQSFPMTAQVPNFTIASGVPLGTETNPVPLVRAMAKITLTNASSNDFIYEGNRFFGIFNQGFVFPQGSLQSPATAARYNETGYNTLNVSYVPETLNADETGTTPLSDRTFIVVKGKYKGLEGYYRIDLYDSGTKKYINFQRNHNYILRFTITGYGAQTEAQAIESPMNGSVVKVDIEYGSAYDNLSDRHGHFLSATNSEVIIYGKPKYYTKGFRGANPAYRYLFAEFKTEKTTGLTPADIQVVNAGAPLSNVTITVVADGDEQKYLLSGELNTLQIDATATVTVRYRNLVKEIKVTRKQYIDAHYANFRLSDIHNVQVQPHKKADGSLVSANAPQWMTLSSAEGNCASTMSNPVHDLEGSAITVQMKENVDGAKMGTYASDNADNEGFRFADVYAARPGRPGRVKMIVAQANADLSGWFGGTALARFPNAGVVDDGTQYNGYMVVERLTDETYISTKALSEYCKSKNPSDNPNLWYMPSSRQLMGVWLTDNSDSRKTSPMQAPPVTTNVSRYVSRENYTQQQIEYYTRSKGFGPNLEGIRNTDTGPLNTSARYPTINFSNGETARGAAPTATVTVGVRCVRNLATNELPAPIAGNTGTVVSGRNVTMDPKGYLSDDYFNGDATNNNNIARVVYVNPPVAEKQNDYTYTWGNNRWNRSSLKQIEQEVTLAVAKTKCISPNRLPTMRELQLFYIYKPAVETATGEFYMDEADGYKVATGTTTLRPDRMLYAMYRYPADEHTAYLHWYWSSSVRPGNDPYPHRLSFHFGDVNARGFGDGQDNQPDHYRCVRTVTP